MRVGHFIVVGRASTGYRLPVRIHFQGSLKAFLLTLQREPNGFANRHLHRCISITILWDVVVLRLEGRDKLRVAVAAQRAMGWAFAPAAHLPDSTSILLFASLLVSAARMRTDRDQHLATALALRILHSQRDLLAHLNSKRSASCMAKNSHDEKSTWLVLLAPLSHLQLPIYWWSLGLNK